MVFATLLFFLYLPVCVPATFAATVIDLPIEEDTYIEEKFPAVSPWNNRNLFLGTDSWYAKGKNRVLIKPDFSVLQNQDILYTDIEKIELLLTAYEYEGTDATVTIDTYTTTAPWSMFSVTWALQPSISTKKDSTVVTSTPGQKILISTAAFVEAYKGYPSTEKGILLKINAETEKAIIFWAHGCDIAPTPPLCAGNHERPRFRVTLRANQLPSLCTIKAPSNNMVTNNPTISVEPNPSTDTDGNTITYIGRICSDISCEITIWQASISPGTKAYSGLIDGFYYVSCSASDGHAIEQWGMPLSFTVDTLPPSTPKLLEEPPFTSTKENQLVWFSNDNEIVDFQIQASERSDFRSYNTYSPWVRENRYSFLHTKEKMFYYRLKSRDIAGNESEWSTGTSTVIDSTMPTIKYFKTNKTLLSPKYNKNGDVTENAYIQGGAEDATINSILLEISDARNKKVYSEIIEDKSYLWTHWPEKKGYADGKYVARIIITDSVNNSIQSDALIIEIDSTPPPIPSIVGIADKQLFNYSKTIFSISCTQRASATVYLGGKIIAEKKEKFTLSMNQKEGSHTLTATCTDLAGNKSTKSVTFTTDTKPPSPPSISYAYSEETKKIEIKIYCREEGKGELFLRGVLVTTNECKKNSYIIHFVQEPITTNYYSTFTARLSDKAGNQSALTEKLIYINVEAHNQKQLVCSSVYDKAQVIFTNTNCNWGQDDITYNKTEVATANEFRSEFEVNTNRIAKVQITVFDCKRKNLWGPRTWTGCVREKIQELNTEGKITPLLTSSNGALQAINIKQIELHHQKEETVTIKKQYLLQFSFSIGEQVLSTETTSIQELATFTPNYPNRNTKRYFSWIFTEPKPVSQWHGNTVYQKPHCGIDFSVSNEQIRAPAQGKVISVGYDKKNDCYSGGNYLGILHPNGLLTYYFHLASTKYPNGRNIKKGDTLTVSEALAKSGNSGMYNCEPLAAHLHFEVRKSALASTHINPIPYFAIDWNTIKTAKTLTFPGRLSGDNPHPKF